MAGQSEKIEVDLTRLSKAPWLVKIPKYIAEKWEKYPNGVEAAKVNIIRYASGNVKVTMSLSDAVLSNDDKNAASVIPPKNYKLNVLPANNQTLAAFSQTIDADEPTKIFAEGIVQKRLECHPVNPQDAAYEKMKQDRFLKAVKPARLVKQLDKVVQNYKPVSTHKYLKEYEEKKKAEGKRSRDDKPVVMDMLYKAFEKHQYYNLKDLVSLTKQPVGYLKEILNEVCQRNVKNGPHKNLWELKPEYRHYQQEKRD